MKNLRSVKQEIDNYIILENLLENFDRDRAIDELDKLRGCDAHASYIIEKSELNALKNLGINLTCEPRM